MHYSQFPQYHHRHRYHPCPHHDHPQWMVIGLATSAFGPNFGLIKQSRPAQKLFMMIMINLDDYEDDDDELAKLRNA